MLAISAGFAAIGAFAGGARRFAAADIFVGWGVGVAAFIVVGTLTRVPFTWIALTLSGVALLCAVLAWRRDRGGEADPAAIAVLWRVLVLASPLILMVAAMRASQWDEFSHWLPNAHFLFRFDSFPNSDLPASPSALPAYPYALPLVVYLTSRLAGGFVENAGAMFNLLIHLFYAPALIFVIRTALGLAPSPPWKWGGAALAILGVTVFSTTFIQKLVFTTYADSTTSVVLAAAAVLAWRVLESLSSAERAEALAEAKALALQGGLVIAVLLNVKQTTLVLVLCLAGGMVVVAWRDPAIRLRDLVALAPRLLLPGFLVYLAWRVYVGQHMAGGEVSFQRMDQWLLPQAFQILGRMLLILSKKGPYLVMMAVMTGFAVHGLLRFRGSFDRLAILVGAVFLGHNFFLWITYLTAFGSGGVVAVSFWRFNTHLGLLGCTGAAFGLALLWRRHVEPRMSAAGATRRALPLLGVLLVVGTPLAFHEKVRFDIRPQKDDVRAVGRDLALALPEGSRVGIIDPKGNGMAAKMLNYELTSGPGASRNLGTVSVMVIGHRDLTGAELGDLIGRYKLTHLWVHQAFPQARETLGVEPAPGASHLLRLENGRWVPVRSWPYRGYDDPFSEDLPR